VNIYILAKNLKTMEFAPKKSGSYKSTEAIPSIVAEIHVEEQPITIWFV